MFIDDALAVAGVSKCDRDTIMATTVTETETTATAALAIGAGVNGNDGTARSDDKTPKTCNWSKFHFCLWLKCLLGPVGYLVLKMLPHFIKFLFTTKNVLHKIVYSLINMVTAIFSGPQLSIQFINEDGDLAKYEPNLPELLLTYLGSVVPFHFINYDLGQKYGKGEFGKIIVGLVMVSIALITIGGIGITMLILAFSVYCIKVMGMFSDNVQETKKK